MNMQSKPQRMSELLASVATTISVSTKSIGLWRLDKAASKESDRAHNAAAGASRTHAARLAGGEERVGELTSKGKEMQEIAREMTTAWGDRRLLANVNLDPFLTRWTKAKKEYDEIHQKLVADAPQLIANAEMNKGTLDAKIPTVEEIRDGFGITFKLEAIADTGSIKPTGLTQQMEDALKRRLEAEVEAAYQLSQKDALDRLAKPLLNMVERLEEYSEKAAAKEAGKSTGKVRMYDSLVTNVEDIAAVFRSFNLTKDPAIEAIATKLDALTGIAADDLKASRQLRDDTAARAKAILDEIGARV